ncbi:MAG: hypothetical protein Q9204_003796 [Flavoplaca sp. TL-2023a]
MAKELDFESIRDRLTVTLEDQLQNVDHDPNRQFAPRSLARNVFDSNHEQLHRLYIAASHMACTSNQVIPTVGCNAAGFVALLSKNDHRSVHRIFATLLCIHMSLPLFQRFLSVFLPATETTKNSVYDTHLPFSLAITTRLFEGDGRQFYKKQFVWSPITLLEQKRIEYLDDRRFCPLPCLSKRPLGSGSFGDVSEVELAEGYIEYRTGLSSRRYFAQKEFIVARHCSRKANIMSPIAGLLHGETTDMKFSMFFPVATCNLREYLKAGSPRLPGDPYPPGGFDIVEKRRIMYQAIGLVSALDRLHQGLDVEEVHSLSCWHLDLESQNVLVTLSETDNETNVLFQISDFGMSRMKRIRQTNQVNCERGYSVASLFQRNASPSLTEGRAGMLRNVWRLKHMEMAQECAKPAISVITFLEGGPNGVRSFEEDRKRAPDYNGSWFFKRITEEQANKQATIAVYRDVDQGMLFMRKDTVDSWFKYLVDKARRSDGEARLLRQFINILFSYMLVADPAQRAGAHAIHKSLKEVWQTLGNAQIVDTHLSAGQSRDPPHGLRRILEIGPPESDNDLAEELRRDAEPRREPHRIASSWQQTEATDCQPCWENRLNTLDRSRGVSRTNGSEARQKVESAEIVGLLCALLCDAARAGNVQMVRMRLRSLPSGTIVKNRDGRTPLSLAAETGATVVIGVLLQAGRLQIDGHDDSGRCALSWAAENGRLKVVDSLLRIGKVDVEHKSDLYHGWTLLCCAAMNGHAQVVECLLQANDVEIDVCDAYGRAPLSWARDKGFCEQASSRLAHSFIDVVKVLLSINMVWTTRSDLMGKSPRSRAAANGHDNIVRLLDSYEKARGSFWHRIPKELRMRRRLRRTE